MTPYEIHAAVNALRDEMGEKCSVSLSIKASKHHINRGGVVSAFCWPLGCDSGAPSIILDADDWQQAIDGVRAKWAEISGDVRRETTRKMALAIIRITADTGGCSDAALRADKFTNSDIEMYGGDACDTADQMGGNGPFRITALEGANAA